MRGKFSTNSEAKRASASPNITPSLAGDLSVLGANLSSQFALPKEPKESLGSQEGGLQGTKISRPNKHQK